MVTERGLISILWNIVTDALLCLQDRNGQKKQGYADDLVSLAHGKYNNVVSEHIQEDQVSRTRISKLFYRKLTPRQDENLRKTWGLRPMHLRNTMSVEAMITFTSLGG